MLKDIVILYVVMLICCIDGWGCAPEAPPPFVSYDTSFNEAEVATLRSAVDAWCEAVGWCPQEVAWADRGRFQRVDHLVPHNMKVCPTGGDCIVSGRNDDQAVIKIARDRASPEDLSVLWVVAAHEIGHFCNSNHTAHGLMAALHDPDDAESELQIDPEAIAAWHEGCP